MTLFASPAGGSQQDVCKCSAPMQHAFPPCIPSWDSFQNTRTEGNHYSGTSPEYVSVAFQLPLMEEKEQDNLYKNIKVGYIDIFSPSLRNISNIELAGVMCE